MKFHKGLAFLGIASAATLGVFVSPGTANASTGGGCSTGTNTGDGVTIRPCVSASGSNPEFDGYMIKNTGCARAYLDLMSADNDSLYSTHEVSCTDGHKGTYAYPGVNGRHYFTIMWVFDNDGNELEQWASPTETFSN